MTARYNTSPTGRALERLDRAIEALETVSSETRRAFPIAAENELDNIDDHIAAVKARLAGAKAAMEAEAENV